MFRRILPDRLLTWEKGCKGDGWDGHTPDVVFTRQRKRNNSTDLLHYRFECREEPWSRDPSVRRLLVRATNPYGATILVSILCSDPDISIEEAVWLMMFNRWLQENDFRNLDRHYGLNQLSSYASKAMMDALRITASNMFANLLSVFRPIYGNYRNDHVMLRNLSRADGFLQVVDGVLHVRLWLKGRFQPRRIKAFRAFLGEMSERINDRARQTPDVMPVRITLLDHPPTW